MNWSKLKENKCPKCGHDLIVGLEQTTGGLILCTCGFKISPKRMREIVTQQVTKSIDREGHYRPEDEVPEIT